MHNTDWNMGGAAASPTDPALPSGPSGPNWEFVPDAAGRLVSIEVVVSGLGVATPFTITGILKTLAPPIPVPAASAFSKSPTLTPPLAVVASGVSAATTDGVPVLIAMPIGATFAAGDLVAVDLDLSALPVASTSNVIVRATCLWRTPP